MSDAVTPRRRPVAAQKAVGASPVVEEEVELVHKPQKSPPQWIDMYSLLF